MPSISITTGGSSRSGGGYRQLQNAPFQQMVEAFARAIQDAQAALDDNSIRTLEIMADPKAGAQLPTGEKVSMIDLGLMPSFYYFAHASIEMRLSISIQRSVGLKGPEAKAEFKDPTKPPAGLDTGVGPVDSAMAGKYSYPPEDSSMVKTRLVPVPPPATLSLRLDALRAARARAEKGDGT